MSELSRDSLIEILKEGAEINCLESLSDTMFGKLADALELGEILSLKVKPSKTSFELETQADSSKTVNANVEIQADLLFHSGAINEIKMKGMSGSKKVGNMQTLTIPKLMRFKTILRSYNRYDNEIEVAEQKKCKFAITDTRVRYSTVLLILVILSLFCFA